MASRSVNTVQQITCEKILGALRRGWEGAAVPVASDVSQTSVYASSVRLSALAYPSGITDHI